MTKYAALLRGIGPSNPNMHQAKLAGVLEELGFSNVQGVISSGNVIFESSSKDIKSLEDKIEKAWPAKLGFNSTTIVRSQRQLRALVDADPYEGAEHSNKGSYQLVTFFKSPPKTPPKANYYAVLSVNALCSSLDNSGVNADTPKFMAQLDKQFGKDQITSRTYKTVQRILQKMAGAS
jgi:uncharacterized protein (DUF1697 family)